MTIERTYHCDGPDCERGWSEAAHRQAPALLTVSGDGPTLHFCGWDCVLRHAATKEPEQVIEP